MRTLEALLDELSPPRPQPDRWAEIAATDRRRRRLVRAAPVAVAAVAALALALAWPFGGGPHGTILERAAAAIGDGPVVHVVIRQGWGGTLVDLGTGAKTEMHGEEELWYDPSRGIRDVSRFGGAVESEAVYPPGRISYLDKTLAGLATGYREALRDGTARVLGPGVVDGEPVYWIRVDTQRLPDVADHELHEWAHDVAVSQDSYEPVATRETRDGQTSPDGRSTVLSVETLPAGSGDFTPPKPVDGVPTMEGGTGSLTLADAARVLGRPALWAGPRVAGLRLTGIQRIERGIERDPATGQWSWAPSGVTLVYGDPAVRSVRISETTTLYPGFQRGVANYSPPEGSVLVFGRNIGVMQRDGIHVALEASGADVLDAARALRPAP